VPSLLRLEISLAAKYFSIASVGFDPKQRPPVFGLDNRNGQNCWAAFDWPFKFFVSVGVSKYHGAFCVGIGSPVFGIKEPHFKKVAFRRDADAENQRVVPVNVFVDGHGAEVRRLT